MSGIEGPRGHEAQEETKEHTLSGQLSRLETFVSALNILADDSMAQYYVTFARDALIKARERIEKKAYRAAETEIDIAGRALLRSGKVSREMHARLMSGGE